MFTNEQLFRIVIEEGFGKGDVPPNAEGVKNHSQLT
jgi:hypothetical protein